MNKTEKEQGKAEIVGAKGSGRETELEALLSKVTKERDDMLSQIRKLRLREAGREGSRVRECAGCVGASGR